MTNQYIAQITAFSEQFRLSETIILEQFQSVKSWEDRYRNLMLLGKSLPVMPDTLKQDESLVSGCESKVWLHLAWKASSESSVAQPQLHVAASSDAKIVKGLIVILISAFIGKNKQQIKAFNINDYLEKLHLLHHLSPSRVNGLNAMLNNITDFVDH